MNILFDINHPAHCHLFKNAILALKNAGHNITIVARDKEVTTHLLKHYDLKFKTLSKAGKGLFQLGLELISRQCKLIPILIKNKIELCVSATGISCAPAAKLLRIPLIVFYDTEHASLQNKLTIPFTDKYFVPHCYTNKIKSNQTQYKGIHELAYLHPKYFKANPDVLSLLNVSESEKFVILRFVSWQAAHDRKYSGPSLNFRRQLIESLKPHAKVFISSEGQLEDEFKPYQINIPPEKIHDALFYAHLFIGEGATMASESACLGTPAIYINPLKIGYITMLNTQYHLVYEPKEESDIITQALNILQNNDKHKWQEKHKHLIEDHIDVTKFQINEIQEFIKS